MMVTVACWVLAERPSPNTQRAKRLGRFQSSFPENRDTTSQEI